MFNIACDYMPYNVIVDFDSLMLKLNREGVLVLNHLSDVNYTDLPYFYVSKRKLRKAIKRMF